MNSGTESRLIKHAGVREGGTELHLERRNQENMILQEKMIVLNNKSVQVPGVECVYAQAIKVVLVSLCKKTYDECNSTD